MSGGSSESGASDRIVPYIVGRGRAGHAAAKALAVVAVDDPQLGLAPVRWLARGEALPDVRSRGERAILVTATPHALHAEAILAAERAGFAGVVTEKPAAVTREAAAALAGVRIPVAVLHVYRQTWGIATLRAMVASGELGRVFAIEGRYWQASAAERALEGAGPSRSWKNDPALAGDFDVWLDLGTHWLDAATYVAGARIERLEAWRSYANAEAPHRDTHVHATAVLDGGVRAMASISKTVHGATNELSLHVLGTRGAASWSFQAPDEIVRGAGRERHVLARRTADLGARMAPFHGAGWLEGYLEIVRQLVTVVRGGAGAFPSLPEALRVLAPMLETTWARD